MTDNRTMANSGNPNAPHLSEDALNDLLIGLGSDESAAHLAACPACRSRVEDFQSTVQAFHATSLAWSEFRSELRNARPTSRPVKTPVRNAYAAPLGWALAAAILLSIGIPTWNAKHRSVESVATATATTSASAPAANSGDSEAQIAQDNELLRSVNLALNSEEDSPVIEYRLLEKPHARARSRSQLRSQ